MNNKIFFVIFFPGHGGNHLSNMISLTDNFLPKVDKKFYDTLTHNAHPKEDNTHWLQFSKNFYNDLQTDKNLVYPIHLSEHEFVHEYIKTFKNFKEKYNEVKGVDWPSFNSTRRIENFSINIQQDIKLFFDNYNFNLNSYNLLIDKIINYIFITNDKSNNYSNNRILSKMSKTNDDRINDYYKKSIKNNKIFSNYSLYYLNSNDLFREYNSEIENLFVNLDLVFDQNLIKICHNNWFDMIRKLF